eukprot:Pgem_evm1s11064
MEHNINSALDKVVKSKNVQFKTKKVAIQKVLAHFLKTKVYVIPGQQEAELEAEKIKRTSCIILRILILFMINTPQHTTS